MFKVGLYNNTAVIALTERLPWAYFLQQGVVFLKFGGFSRTLRFRGGDAATMDSAELISVMERFHDALRRVRGQMSIHFEARRRPAPAYPGADLSDDERRAQFPDPVSFLFDEERRDAYDEEGAAYFETDRYITFTWKCSKAAMRRAQSWFVTGRRSSGIDANRDLHDFLQQSQEVKGMLDDVMMECDWLDDDEIFEYLHSTVSTKNHPVKPSFGKARIDHDVADCRVVGGMSPMLGDCHMRVISVKNSPDTVPVALAALDGLPFEHRYTVRWMGMEHSEGLRHVERQLRDWNMLGIAMIPMLIAFLMKKDTQKENHTANAMKEDAQDAIQAVRADDLTVGHANINVVVWDENLTQLERKVQAVTDILNRQSLITTSYGVASLDTWLGTLPGHIYADMRRPVRTSVNLAHFAPYSSIWSGDKTNAHLTAKLGQAVRAMIIARTDGSTPFWVNLHTDGDLAHTLIFGPSGNGKTTLINGMIVAWRSVPKSKVVIFTIKGGGEVVTRMLGGVSYDVGKVSRGALGFQPLAHADDKNERVELQDWLLDLLAAQKIEATMAVKADLTQALELIAENPAHRRSLTHLTSYIKSEDVKAALRHYTLDGGIYGRLLDDDKDSIAVADIMNFDMTELLRKKAIAPHVLAHLFRYVERRIFTGDPVMLVVDEAWRFLGDALFAAKFEDWLRAARSKNVVVVFATQNMKDAFDGTMGKVLADRENVPNTILLPNDKARNDQNRPAYEKLGFHGRDIAIVSKAKKKKQYYFTCPKGRRLFDFKLGPFGQAVCATTDEDEVRAAKKIATENPERFRELFLESKGLHQAAAFIRMERSGDQPFAVAAE